MSSTLTIAPETARPFLALRHFLAPPRSLPPAREGILTVFERFGSIQFDPLEVAGRNHDLVLLARVPGYRRELTDALLVRGACPLRDLTPRCDRLVLAPDEPGAGDPRGARPVRDPRDRAP